MLLSKQWRTMPYYGYKATLKASILHTNRRRMGKQVEGETRYGQRGNDNWWKILSAEAEIGRSDGILGSVMLKTSSVAWTPFNG